MWRRFFRLECFQLASCLFFAVFRLCGFLGGWWLEVKTGNFQANIGADGCGKVSGVWESLVDVQDRRGLEGVVEE